MLTDRRYLWWRDDVTIRRGRKYSPDQPRDERGRFGDGAGKLPDLSDLVRGPHGDDWRRITNEITSQDLGNCYQAAGTLMMAGVEENLGLENAVIVQATVVGRGPLEGERFGHSWLEADGPDGRVAYDWSNNNHVVMPAVVYRALGQAEDISEYDEDEAMRQMVDTGNYGPWTPTPLASSPDWENSGPV